MTTEHVFNHLGQAPYKFVGHEAFVEKRVMVAPGIETIIPRGTSCDHCGTYIVDAFWLRSSDGKQFKVGCDCIGKAGMHETHKSAKSFLGRVRRQRQARELKYRREARQRMREAFLSWGREELSRLLKVEHNISKSIRANFARNGYLSSKQFYLLRKIEGQVKIETERRENEVKVQAPEGRFSVEGTIVSVKEKVSQWGWSLKMTVKVETETGVWLAWGTVPAGLESQGELRGRKVSFTATFKRSDKDESFAFFKRPKLA